MWCGGERVTGRKARGLQMEEIGCKCQTFFLSLLSSRRKQTISVSVFIPFSSAGDGLVTKLCPTLATRTVACQAPLSIGFSRQGYWSGLPFPSPGDLPDPGIELRSPALQADDLPTEL